jgi:RNA polymerase sigma factor (sigma-70 family)
MVAANYAMPTYFDELRFGYGTSRGRKNRPRVTPSKMEPCTYPDPSERELPTQGHYDFDAVYREYAPLLRHIAWRRCSVPLADAEAIVHEVFATYIAAQSRVSNLRAYLISGIYQAANRYRHHRRGEEPLTDEVKSTCEIDDAEIDMITARLALTAALARLRPRCREILRRRYLQDEDTRTIASEMQISTDNVAYVLHGCRKRLRETYDELTRVQR